MTPAVDQQILEAIDQAIQIGRDCITCNKKGYWSRLGKVKSAIDAAIESEVKSRVSQLLNDALNSGDGSYKP